MKFIRHTLPQHNDFGFEPIEPQIPNGVEIQAIIKKTDLGFIINMEGYENSVFLLGYDLDWKDGAMASIVFYEGFYDINIK